MKWEDSWSQLPRLKNAPAGSSSIDPPPSMSSFFTLPASQRKRKREDRAGAPASKKRGVDADGDVRNKSGKKTSERDESISGSDLDEDAESVASAASEEESGSDSDEGETAADRRLKLAERYLENVRDEVDDYGFDAAEIDRDLIAERLKEDVVCSRISSYSDLDLTVMPGRIQRTSISSNCFRLSFFSRHTCVLSGRYANDDVDCRTLAICLYGIQGQDLNQMGACDTRRRRRVYGQRDRVDIKATSSTAAEETETSALYKRLTEDRGKLRRAGPYQKYLVGSRVTFREVCCYRRGG